MILDCVLTSVNENPLYIINVPFFIKCWKKLYPNVDIKIILIATSIPIELIPYTEYIILFEPLKNISTAFISQYIRLLYPAILNYTNGVMITDIDIVPMNRTYYTDNIKNIDNAKFIYLRHVLLNTGQLAMCYNIASPKTWSDIFNINSLQNIKQTLIKRYNSINYKGRGKSGWNTDQTDLYKCVMKWNNYSHNFIHIPDKNTGFCRLCRSNFKILDKKIKINISNNKYTDYHCHRPFKLHEILNNSIYDLI